MIHCFMLINIRGLIRLVKLFNISHIVDKDKYMREVEIVFGRSTNYVILWNWENIKLYIKDMSLYIL